MDKKSLSQFLSLFSQLKNEYIGDGYFNLRDCSDMIWYTLKTLDDTHVVRCFEQTPTGFWLLKESAVCAFSETGFCMTKIDDYLVINRKQRTTTFAPSSYIVVLSQEKLILSPEQAKEIEKQASSFSSDAYDFSCFNMLEKEYLLHKVGE